MSKEQQTMTVRSGVFTLTGAETVIDVHAVNRGEESFFYAKVKKQISSDHYKIYHIVADNKTQLYDVLKLVLKGGEG